jgi:HEAT repeat protein
MPRPKKTVLCLALLLVPAAAPAWADSAKDRAKLIKQLAKDRDPAVRARAAESLGSDTSQEVVPALAAALKDPYPEVRSAAAHALGTLGEEHAKEAIPALRAALDDQDLTVLRHVAWAFKAVGGEPADLIPAWRRLLNAWSCHNRVWAARSLWGYVPPKDLFTAALDCQAATDSKVANDAALLMKDILERSNDPSLAGPILEALKQSQGRDRGRYARALSRFKPPPAEAVDPLTRLLKDSEVDNRADALATLGRMGGLAKPAVPAIAEVLRTDAAPDVRARAATALGDIGPPAQQAIPALVQALQKDASVEVREAACYGLQEMRQLAREAIPALREALRDPDGKVSSAAQRALFRVDQRK